MDIEEYQKWILYYQKEPFFADRQEHQLAIIAHSINAFAGGKAKFEDFFISKKDKIKTNNEALRSLLKSKIKGNSGTRS